MNRVPPGAHPGSPLALDIGCTCRDPRNADGAGSVEKIRIEKGGVTLLTHDVFWYINRRCKIHGAGKFVPFRAPR